MPQEIKACLLDNWTLDKANAVTPRIDFVFARTGGAGVHAATSGSEHTVTFNEAGDADRQLTGSDNASLVYSDHRAVKARVNY